jgi:hypothetical protein
VKDLAAETIGPVGDIRTVVSTLSASACTPASSLSGVSGTSSIIGEATSSRGARCSTVISYLAAVRPSAFAEIRSRGAGNGHLLASDRTKLLLSGFSVAVADGLRENPAAQLPIELIMDLVVICTY